VSKPTRGQVDHRRRRARGVQRRAARWLAIGFGALIGLAAAWMAITGAMAYRDLTAMNAEFGQLRTDVGAGRLDDAKAAANDLARHASRAHSLTSGPAWWAASIVPVAGDPVRTIRGISASADELGSNTAPKLLDISARFTPSQLQLKDHQVDIGWLEDIAPELSLATAEALRQQHLVAALPKHTWLSPVNRSSAEVVSELAKINETLNMADQAVSAAPMMLGFTTPQRYFIAFQNEAEARGTGGLPGAFGIVVADHGKLTFTHFGNDGELVGIDSGLDFGPAYDQTWHDFEPTKQYLNSDVDPDFRYAGQIWAAMWQKKSGEHVDGAISVDPTALSYLLAVTGPATLPDGSHVSSSNIVALTESSAYTNFADQAERKAYLLDIAQAADEQILSGSSHQKAMYDAVSRAVDERRLLLWDQDPSVESLLSATVIGGAVHDTDAPYSEPVIINYGGNKLDYYLRTSVSLVSSGCGAQRDVTVTVTLTNGAPDNLPPYVTARTDAPDYPTADGDNRVLLYYVGTHAGKLTSVTVNGHQSTVAPGTAGNHPTYRTLVELPRGVAQIVVLHLTEPASADRRVIVDQPAVTSMMITDSTTRSCR
jgi:hypothetical protein